MQLSYQDSAGEIRGSGDLDGTKIVWRDYLIIPYVELETFLSQDALSALKFYARFGVEAGSGEFTSDAFGTSTITRTSQAGFWMAVGLQVQAGHVTVSGEIDMGGGGSVPVDVSEGFTGRVDGERVRAGVSMGFVFG